MLLGLTHIPLVRTQVVQDIGLLSNVLVCYIAGSTASVDTVGSLVRPVVGQWRDGWNLWHSKCWHGVGSRNVAALTTPTLTRFSPIYVQANV